MRDATLTKTSKPLGIAFASALLLAVLIAGTYMAWRWNTLRERSAQMERLIAVSWGDSDAHPALYGAYVYYEPQADGKLKVFVAVRIDRSTADDGYQHEPREVGTANSPEEAVAKWGTATWSRAGLMLGTGPQALFPRDELERHR